MTRNILKKPAILTLSLLMAVCLLITAISEGVVGINADAAMGDKTPFGNTAIMTLNDGFSTESDDFLAVVASSISLDESELYLNIGETYTLTATLEPSDATQTLFWSADCPVGEEPIVSVDQSGVVTALRSGTTVVTAAVGGWSAHCDVTVTGVLDECLPVLRAASEDYLSITLRWNSCEDTEVYELYRAASQDGDYVHIASIDDGTYIYKDANLNFNTTYWYKLCASRVSNGVDEHSRFSEPITVTTALPAPILNIVSTSYNSVKLGWAKVVGASGYYVYRSVDNGDYTLVKTLSGSYVSFTNTDLTTDTQYSYYIAAYRSVGRTRIAGTASDSLEAMPKLTTPASPTLSYYGGKPKLSWKTVSGATSYNLYRSDSVDGEYSLVVTVLKGKTLSYTDKAIEFDSPVYYRVEAVRTVGENVYTSAVSGSTIATPVVSAPDLSVVSTTYNSVKLSWGKVNGVSGYYIYRSADGGANYTLIKTLSSGYSGFTNTGLTAGVEYRYKISAYRTVNKIKTEGLQSGEVFATPMISQAKAPVVSVSSYYLRISWSSVPGATAYNLYRSADGRGYELLATTKSSIRSYSDIDVVKGVSYSYKVAASRSGSDGALSAATSGTPGLPAPTGLKAAAVDCESIKLTWRKSLGATGYSIYRSSSKTGLYRRCGSVEGNTTLIFTDTGLNTDETYYYVVKAVRRLGGVTTYSPAVSNTSYAKTKLLAPSGFTAVSDYDSITLSWTAAKGATGGYEIYRSTSSSRGYKLLASVDTTSYDDISAAYGKTMFYKVRSVSVLSDRTVFSSYTPYKSGKVILATPVITAQQTAAGEITLNWIPVDGAQSYVVYRATGKWNTYKSVGVIEASDADEYIDSGLSTGRTYYYKLRAARIADGNTIYGAYSAYKSAKA